MSQWSFVTLARQTGHAIVAPPWRMLAPVALTPEGVRSASVSFGPFVGAIPAPLTAPGESIIVRYGVFARAYTGEHDPVPNPLFDPVVVVA